MPSSIMEEEDPISSKVLLLYSEIDSTMHMSENHVPHQDYIAGVKMWFCQDSGVGML